MGVRTGDNLLSPSILYVMGLFNANIPKINVREYRRSNQKSDNPEKLAT